MQNRIKELKELLIRKEQECEELQAENEKLKECSKNKCAFKCLGNEFCPDAEKEINKYKQALDEIEKAVISNCNSCNGDCEYPCDLHKILSIIKQAKEEE